MLKGKVKWFSDTKGYGFIEIEGRRDVFVHYASLKRVEQDPLQIGQVVEFEIRKGQSRPDTGEVDS